jgi:threonine synthase
VAEFRRTGWLADGEEVVVVNTGAGLKYPQTMPAYPPLIPRNGSLPPS